MTSNARERVDIAVVGAGIAGLATALAIALNPGPAPRLLVCDPRLGVDGAAPSTLRAVAIAPTSRRFLARLGVWSRIEAGAQPMSRMVLGDSRPGAVPVPTFLRFEAGEQGEPLAHMVLQDDLRDALLDACRDAGVALRGDAVTTVTADTDAVTPEGGAWRTRLLVAADGGRSHLRDRAGIKTVGWDYGQTAIVATLAHSHDHDGEAIQYFLPGGPLAFLPMRAPDGSGRRSSIVWTERTAEADRLMRLPAGEFCAALLARGGLDRGDLALEDVPSAHLLAVRLARSLVAPRFALVGDAARTIHPLAGQGLNLGLQDAEALSTRVAAAMVLGLDPGAPRLLEAYGRDRRADQVAMAVATDGLNRLFSNDSGPLRLVRDIGLGLVDRSPRIKRLLMQQASGLG